MMLNVEMKCNEIGGCFSSFSFPISTFDASFFVTNPFYYLNFLCLEDILTFSFTNILMTDLQKQPKMATKEQLRLAELITGRGGDATGTSDDQPSQKHVKKVVELTNCTSSEAEVALIDCEGRVEDAVALLLDKPEELVLWSQKVKSRKSKSASVPTNVSNNNFVSNGGRKGTRFRRDETEGTEHTIGDEKQTSFTQGRPKRILSNKDQNGRFDRTKSHERFDRGPRGQARTGGPRRFPGKTNAENDKKEAVPVADGKSGDWGTNGWPSSNKNDAGWGGTGDGNKAADKDGFPKIETYVADSSTTGKQKEERDEEWKNGPRVFMPSSGNATVAVNPNTSSNVSATSSWPSLDKKPVTSNTDAVQQTQPNKPKTFASVAATKKVQPPPPLEQPKQQQQVPVVSSAPVKQSTDQQQTPQSSADLQKNTEEPVAEWTSSVDWGTAAQSPPPTEPSPAAAAPRQPEPPAIVPTETTFEAPKHPLSANKEYTDHLKNTIGIMQAGQQQQSQPPAPIGTSSASDYYHQQHQQQQQISQLQQQQSIASDTSEFDKKVEFATGDLPPPISNTTSYQFGFQYNAAREGGITSNAPMTTDPWKQHISSVELDRSMLKNSTANVLSTMTSIPTTSSNVSAHFSTSTQQQSQSNDYQQQRNTNSNLTATGLSLTDTVTVNFPPTNGPNGLNNVSTSLPPSASTVQQQQQQGKPMYTVSNPSMVAAAASQQQQQHLQHLHQQQQAALYHQTSAAPAAVPQFPNYNMPYMYSPVATAQTLSGTTAEVDRFLLQQYAPYSGLDVQLGAMSMGPPTTLAAHTHRTPMDAFMDSKYGQPQQQQSVNQGNTGAMQQQAGQQQQRGPGQPEAAAMFGGGGGHVAPPPGFGMPTAPTQQYIPQHASLQSLFQMPTYPHPYQQHQFMMQNANRMPTSQRPTQTSPPEGNGHGQRRHDNRGTDSQGYGGGNDSNEHSTGAGPQQSYVNNYKSYRPYM